MAASAHEELSSVRCHISFGAFPQWAGMPRGYLYLKAKSINAPALKPSSLLYRHVSQRKISFVMDGVIHIAWETGELVSYRDNPLSDILLPDGTSQIRTSQLVKLDAAGNPTLGEAAFYDEVMADSSVVRYDAATRQPVRFVTSAGVIVTVEEMKAELDIVQASGLRQYFNPADGLMEVETISDTSYRISWYPPAQVQPKQSGDLYGHTGTPEKTYTISGSLSDQDGNFLTLEETLRGNRAAVTTWHEKGQEWTMTKGEGADAQIARLKIYGIPMGKWEYLYTQEGADGTVLSRTREVIESRTCGPVIVKRTDGYDAPGALVTEYEYDNRGRLTLETLPDGSTISYQNDAQGRETSKAYVWPGGGKHTTRTTYADQRPNDYRPASVTELIVADDGTETVLNRKVFTYEETPQLERITVTETALGSPHSHTGITERYGKAEENVHARGKLKFTQSADGTQDFFTYTATTEYDALYKRNRETRVNGATLPGWSESFVDYIDAKGDTVCSERHVLLSHNTWSLLSREEYAFNASHQWTRRTKANGRTTARTMMCKGPLTETDEDGVLTTYSYNTAKTLIETIRAATPATPETIHSRTLDGAGRETMRRTDTGAMTTVTRKTYDLQNRLLTETDALGRVTQYEYLYSGRGVSRKTPAGATYVTISHAVTGAIDTETGTGQREIHYAPELVADGIRTMIFALNRETPGFIMLSRRTENGFGETVREEQASTQEDAWIVTENGFNAKGQLIRSQTADMAPVIREYDVVGRMIKETVVLTEPATPQNSRITAYAYAVEKREDGIYTTTTVTGYNAAGEPLTSTRSTLASQTRSTVESKSITVDIDGNARRQWTEYGTGTERVQKSQIPTSDAIATVHMTDGFVTKQTDHLQTTNAYTRSYRVAGILQTQTDGRGNTTTAETDIAGRTVKTTDAAGNIQTIAYDPATGQPSLLTDALGKQTCYAYDQRGRKTAEWGTNIQAAAYGYNDADQLVKLTTFRASAGDITTNPTGRTDGDVTAWKYDAATGLELRKTYADGTHADKVYDSRNRLSIATSPRGIVTTYGYDNLTGALLGTAHSDATPGSSATYNHLGQLATVSDASGRHSFAYNAKGRLNQNSLELDGGTVNLFESYDEYGRNMSYLMNRRSASGPVELLTSGMWRWDGEGRLVQAGIFSEREIQYSYLPGTHLLAGITLDNGVTMARSYEPHRDLITGIAYRKEDGTHLATRTYAYDALGRPTARTQQRGTETPRQDAFGYNTKSELTSASIGQAAFAYAFDNIGNRKTAQQTTEHLTYATNPLNQYTSITPQQQPAFAPAFDADGNQTRLCTTTGEWNIVYDANNRPIRFTKVDGSVIVENGYDSMGRRYMQKVTENGTVTRHERYLYRGYLQIAALDILHGGKQKHTFFWDPTEPLATRPLIMLASDDNRYTYAHDLTKNVTELLDAEGNIAAAYDYDPFGKVTEAGVGAGLNPIRWSSEVYDAELGLVYYNYRHYNPADGRWINRDPIDERGGMNLYGFVKNKIVFEIDILGNTQVLIPGEKGEFNRGVPVSIKGNIVSSITGNFKFECEHDTGNIVIDSKYPERSIRYTSDGIFTHSKYYIDRFVEHPRPRTNVYQIVVTVAGLRDSIMQKTLTIAGAAVTVASLFPASSGVSFVVGLVGSGTYLGGVLGPKDELLVAQVILRVELACECDDASVRISGTDMFIPARHWYPKVKSHTVLKIN
ncbi:RHS repeat-associated core domain-containing protein [Akkermansia glycaniphila]|uniref:RHS repeat domain-containing protein n=1 Tax=Akkermansia glycaniphila TaxID=1679444 RepID=UPI001C01FD89|nr:RHS repeat-associated core domain-containing protein [Akkermansia glycaniphila]MBT9449339.1 RHS repeat-associated core domain-containing protein [Akkermansia glycaniphila]